MEKPGRGSKRQAITLAPPQYVEMTPDERDAAVRALAALIGVARERAAEARHNSSQPATDSLDEGS